MYFSGLTFYQKHLPTCFMSVDAFYGLNGSNLSYIDCQSVNQLVPNTSLVYGPPSNNQMASVSIDIESTDCVFKVDATQADRVLLYDTFTDTNGTFLTNHTPDIGGQYFSGTGVVVDEMYVNNGQLVLGAHTRFYFPTNKIILPATNFYVEFDIQCDGPIQNDVFINQNVLFSSFNQYKDVGLDTIETSYGYNLLQVFLSSNGTSFIQGIGSDGSILDADQTIGSIEDVIPGYLITDKIRIRAEFINYGVFKVYVGGKFLGGSSFPLAGTIGNNQFCIFLSGNSNYIENSLKIDNLKIGLIGDTFKTNGPIIRDMRIDKPDVASGTPAENFRYYTYFTSFEYGNLPNISDYTLNVDWLDSGYIIQINSVNNTTDPDASAIRRLNFTNLPVYEEYKIVEVIHFDLTLQQLYYTTNSGTMIQIVMTDKLLQYTGIFYGERVMLKFYWDGNSMTLVDSTRLTSSGV